ncbi:MAG TPA: hypothetical protein VFZ53_01885 [Polyangiaceae bacterium]
MFRDSLVTVLLSSIPLACGGSVQLYPGPALADSEVAAVDVSALENVKIDGKPVAANTALILPGRHRVSGFGEVSGARYKAAISFEVEKGRDYTVGIFWMPRDVSRDGSRDPDAPVLMSPVLSVDEDLGGNSDFRVVSTEVGDNQRCSAPAADEKRCPD